MSATCEYQTNPAVTGLEIDGAKEVPRRSTITAIRIRFLAHVPIFSATPGPCLRHDPGPTVVRRPASTSLTPPAHVPHEAVGQHAVGTGHVGALREHLRVPFGLQLVRDLLAVGALVYLPLDEQQPVLEALFELAEMPLDVLVAPEVRGPEAGGGDLPYVVDALYPQLDVDLGRRRRRTDIGLPRQPDTGHVTGKERP